MVSLKMSTSQHTHNSEQIKANNCKSIDLVIIIELTRAILMPGFANFLRNSFIHFRMSLYFITGFLRVTDS